MWWKYVHVITILRLCYLQTASQDGGIGRHTVPPCTTKRRTTTNLKTKKQLELTENQTVWKSDNKGFKETFNQTGRRGGQGQLGREDLQQGGSWWTPKGGWQRGRSHIRVQINREEQLGSETDRTTQGSCQGKWSLKTLTENSCGGWGYSERRSQPHRRVPWRDPQGPRACTSPPTRESAREGPNLLVGGGGSDWEPAGAEQA